MDLLPKQDETTYEELKMMLAQKLYEQAFTGAQGRQKVPWKKMEPNRQEPYITIAMIAMGHLFGAGEWKRIKMSNQKNRVVFQRTDK